MPIEEITLTTHENLVVGLFGGTVEASLQMPLLTWKYQVQQGLPFPKTLRGWYRGAFINASMIAPITGLQMGAHSILQNLWGKAVFTKREQIATAVAAGAISTFIVSPSNLLVIQQQKMGCSLSACLSAIHKEFGFHKLFRGFNACALRESIYSGGYLGVAPATILYIREHYNINLFAATMIGSCFAGSIGAFLTHPIDTAKTCMQQDLGGRKYSHIARTMQLIYTKRGFDALFNGFVPRTIRICGAVFVINSFLTIAKEVKFRSMYFSDPDVSYK